jgi:hypothetical protein
VAPITVATGRTYRSEPHARFALSCVALGAVLRAGASIERAIERHLDSLGLLVPVWAEWGEVLTPDLAPAALAALAEAPERWQPLGVTLAGLIAKRQRDDGTWPRVDFFDAVNSLSLLRDDAAVPVLIRASGSLVQRQREDGSFGSVARDERSLVALRALLRVEGRAGTCFP